MKSKLSYSGAMLIVGALCVSGSAFGSASAQTYSYFDLADRLSELEYLATPPAIGEKGGSFSSWDRGKKYNKTAAPAVLLPTLSDSCTIELISCTKSLICVAAHRISCPVVCRSIMWY